MSHHYQYFLLFTYVKSIDNDVTHRKIFTLSKLLVIFYTLKYGEFSTYQEVVSYNQRMVKISSLYNRMVIW